MLKLSLVACLLILTSFPGCTRRGNLPHPGQHPQEQRQLDPAHPEKSAQTLQGDLRAELKVGRYVAGGATGLSVFAAVALLALGLRSFAALAGAGALGGAAVYASVLLVTFTLPWLPLAGGLLVVSALIAVLVWAVKHRGGISKELASHIDIATAYPKLSDAARAVVDKVKPLV